MDDDDHGQGDGDETLEEGRVTLHLLERQLKRENSNNNSTGSGTGNQRELNSQDDASEGSSRQNGGGSRQSLSLMAERRLLDQQPRDARLQLRKGSPLGLTLEELDDRGLLEGGGVVPSYYTSIKQKNRRQLELQDRSSRMRQRGQEDVLKLKISSNIIRMIRVLVQKGLNLEDCFRSYSAQDSEGSDGGMMEKDSFVNILRKFDLPFTLKDLFSFSQRYAISSHQIDYESFLNEIQHGLDGDDSLGSNPISHSNPQLLPSSSSNSSQQQPFHLINDLKQMLLQSKTILKKSYDEIYRMFSRWDNYGMGVVTITQFFRVLDQLHIQFRDYEQDFLVDLLDSDGQGKVDFEGLLAFCFASDDEMDRIPTHVNTVNVPNGVVGMTDGEESLAGSIGTGGGTISTDKKSVLKRPHTASAFRVTEENVVYDAYQQPTPNGHRDLSNASDQILPLLINTNQTSRRPLTAQGRVLNGEYKAKPRNNHDDFDPKQPSIKTHSRPQSASASRPLVDEKPHGYILDIQSDNEGDDDVFPLPAHTHKPFDMAIIHPSSSEGRLIGNYNQSNNIGHSLSQSLVISPISQDKSYKAQSSLTSLAQSSVEITSNSIHSLPQPAEIRKGSFPSNMIQPAPIQGIPSNSSSLHFTTAKSNLRSALSLYLRQKNCSIADIFSLFDQKNVRFFGVKELMETSQHYFQLNLAPSIASALVTSIAVGGYDRISYSDLLVFLTDPMYQELEEKLQIQIAEQLEQQGREYQYLLFSILSQEGQPSTVSTAALPSASHPQSSGIVSSNSFRQSLTKLGFSLIPTDIDRIVTKYDTHGTGKCSVSRFMSMIQNNFYWKFALNTLAYHEEAVEECQIVRQRMKSSSRHAITYNYSNEMIDMAEYLGIRILSEPHLLWIVQEAVNAPLPDGWTMHQNKEGKTFFHNTKQNITRWDHPLDPYFRKLRDENRKREFPVESSQERDEVGGGSYPNGNGHLYSAERNSEILSSLHQEQSLEGEDDIRDDMSDYYKLRKPPKNGNAPPHSQRIPTTNPTGQALPNATAVFARSSRPQSAPDDRPNANDNLMKRNTESNHVNSLSSIQNSKTEKFQNRPANILLPGGTYIDTGARGNLGMSKIPASRVQSRGGHTPPKKGPVQAHAMYQSGPVYNLNGKREKNRASSTSRLRPSNSSGARVHKPSTNETYRLNRMYDDNVFEDLDAVMKSRTTKQPTNQWREANPDFGPLDSVVPYQRPPSQYYKSEKKTKDSDTTVWL